MLARIKLDLQHMAICKSFQVTHSQLKAGLLNSFFVLSQRCTLVASMKQPLTVYVCHRALE